MNHIAVITPVVSPGSNGCLTLLVWQEEIVTTPNEPESFVGLEDGLDDLVLA